MTKKALSFWDVVRFAAVYWLQQSKRLSAILLMILTAALLEAYLPTALSTFLGAIRTQANQDAVFLALGIFIGIYLSHTLLFVGALKIYNIFETKIFKTLIDDVFTHIQKLPEQFFANNFSGSIISKIQRARQQIENFEDQFLIRIFSTLIILIGSIFFFSIALPGLGVVYFCLFMYLYLGKLLDGAQNFRACTRPLC